MNLQDLPTGVPDWLTITGGGTVSRLERAVARREAWIVDIDRPDGQRCEGFLRLDRQPWPDNPWPLAREAGIVRALAGTRVPVPGVIGMSETLNCVLFERSPGRADLPAMPADQRRAVLEHFFDILADLHTLDVDALPLPPLARPATPRDCALAEVDVVTHLFRDFLARHCDPLISYGLDWLERFAPEQVARLSLVQGDTGPVNFLFVGDRVSAVIDWEWGHLGDPLEDLGNVCVRNFWNPSGDFDGLFERYEKRSGIPVDRFRVGYYRVQQNMRGMLPIAANTAQLNPREPLAWHLAYRYVGDRSTVEALADAMRIPIAPPEFPTDETGPDILAQAALWSLENDIAPSLAPGFARARLHDAGILVRCLDRVHRFESVLAAIELDELHALLGQRPASLAEGLAQADMAIRARRLADEKVLPWLARRAYRLEWLYAPAATLYPDRRWTPI
ncbi:MAG: phosphotransferase family protein [Proteobacteria bacterium]|nr:phosphotransferase family protein [Pseudomonadota bacterium]HQR03544.1 phosphotransferase family protein [Rhodocyclaceae bacterium]